MHEVTQAAYGGVPVAGADVKSGPVMALESEIAYLTHVAEEAERISSNIAGNGPPRDTQKLSNSPAPVLSISQRISGAAGQISALRERIGNAMSRIEQSL